jgi:hypothetical protein
MLFSPFLRQESYDLIRASKELVPVPPNRVGRVGALDELRIPRNLSIRGLTADNETGDRLRIPSILCGLYLDPRGLEGEWGKWGLRCRISCHSWWIWRL